MNPVTEQLKKHIIKELKVYSNLAPQVSLLLLSTSFLGMMIYNIASKDAMDLDFVSIIVEATAVSLLFGAFGYFAGKFASDRLQKAQLMRLQRERKKRRDGLKDKLKEKELMLKRLEEYTK